MTRRTATKPFAPLLGVLIFVTSVAAAVTLDDLQKDIDAGKFDAAARQSQSYLDAHPGNRDARFLHARALAGQGHTDKAIAAYESLAADFPLRVEPANNLAVLHADQGEYDKARTWLEKALATQPAYATAHRNLGDVYTALAQLAYRKALGSDDSDKRLPLTMLDRLYYAQESVAPGNAPAPAPAKRPATPESENKNKISDQDSRSIVQTIRAWALAWSSQDFDAYTDFYADEYDPGDGMSRAQWLSLRRARLGTPEDIHIRLEDPSITRLANGTVRVDFTQEYESPRYSDRVDKHMILVRKDAGWRILREASGKN
ncbi:tetratricopeptide repeat protein [Salinisphaera sp.]|uniref:L,D-transpeptidase Cds6 family protein n=1 Tax=Salinisphaera sp. TaxID=1914330 RepID=UPI0025DA407F|nr:tetratricopeptide repeat protein [Salinisphaera sp.]